MTAYDETLAISDAIKIESSEEKKLREIIGEHTQYVEVKKHPKEEIETIIYMQFLKQGCSPEEAEIETKALLEVLSKEENVVLAIE